MGLIGISRGDKYLRKRIYIYNKFKLRLYIVETLDYILGIRSILVLAL